MDANKKTAKIVGALFIFAMVVEFVVSRFTSPF